MGLLREVSIKCLITQHKNKIYSNILNKLLIENIKALL
jgi:hypothetical protein